MPSTEPRRASRPRAASLATTFATTLAASVHTYPWPALIVDDRTKQIVEANERVRELVGKRRGQIVGQLVTDADARRLLGPDVCDILLAGRLEAFRIRQVIDPGASRSMEVIISGRVAGPDGARMTVVVIEGPGLDVDTTAAPASTGTTVVGVANAEWEIEQVSGGLTDLLGIDDDTARRGTVLDRVHPEDHAELIVTVGQLLSEHRAIATRLRVQHAGGGWRELRVVIALLGNQHPREFAFVLEPADEADREPNGDHAARLRRIAHALAATGLVDTVDSAAGLRSVPGIADLSDRQRDILVRLLDGDRVPSIAGRLYLSQSTVRNHLAQIYKKVGVHSQAELVDLVSGRNHRHA